MEAATEQRAAAKLRRVAFLPHRYLLDVRVRGGHGVHIVGLAGSGLATVKFSPIPRRDAALLVRTKAGRGNIVAPEDGVRAIGKAIQRLQPRRRIGNRIEIGRWIVARAVVLVIATAALGNVGRRRNRRCFATCRR